MATHDPARPARHAAFVYYDDEPLNGAPPPWLTRGKFVTPADQFYIRCHGEIPVLDADTYRLSIGGLVARRVKLSLQDLRRDFNPHTVAATLQCAGNRRDELDRVKPIPGETMWTGSAISHGVWTGARLADVLASVGVHEGAVKFVEFIGHDRTDKKKKPTFGGSVPLAKALAPETLLAYELDGEPLPQAHGFPLRVIVPGYLGARSVKWLREINLLAHPSRNLFQAEEYRLHPPTATKEDHDAALAVPLGEVDVTSYICRIHRGRPGGGDPMVVEGYAYVGGGRGIRGVEVSDDDGAHWTPAELLPLPDQGVQTRDEEKGRWSWRFWRAELPAAEKAPVQIVARATDDAGHSQPERPEALWNFKGYANNAWHRLVSARAD